MPTCRFPGLLLWKKVSKKAQDWSKISHIADIEIQSRYVQGGPTRQRSPIGIFFSSFFNWLCSTSETAYNDMRVKLKSLYNSCFEFSVNLIASANVNFAYDQRHWSALNQIDHGFSWTNIFLVSPKIQRLLNA